MRQSYEHTQKVPRGCWMQRECLRVFDSKEPRSNIAVVAFAQRRVYFPALLQDPYFVAVAVESSWAQFSRKSLSVCSIDSIFIFLWTWFIFKTPFDHLEEIVLRLLFLRSFQCIFWDVPSEELSEQSSEVSSEPLSFCFNDLLIT